nr:hypothetical protein [Tanacetum cinerariifolium]
LKESESAHTFLDLENLNNVFLTFFNFNTWPLQEYRCLLNLRYLHHPVWACLRLVDSNEERTAAWKSYLNLVEEEEGLNHHGVSFETCLYRQGTLPCLPVS